MTVACGELVRVSTAAVGVVEVTAGLPVVVGLLGCRVRVPWGVR